MSFWQYWNENIDLSENFSATSDKEMILDKKEALLLMETGKYLPIKKGIKDDLPVYALTPMEKDVDSSIANTIRQMARLEIIHTSLEGKKLPSFSAKDTYGNLFTENFSDWIVVIKTWFIKCGPCEEQRPAYEALLRKYAGKNISLISFADDDKTALQNFIEEKNITFVVLPEQSEYIRNQLGLYQYPTYIILLPNGEVFKVVNSMKKVEKILAGLEPLMKTLPPPGAPR